MSRQWGPRDLADTLSTGEAGCPLPATHDRLHECHYWWHGMARNYHEPAQFRWNLGAFIQAARNTTWMMQAEKHVFSDFSWYEVGWRNRAKELPVLQWLNTTRVHLTKQGPISATSWAIFSCLRPAVDSSEPLEEHDQPLAGEINPYVCSHAILRSGPREDHPHEIERNWEIDGLPTIEALEACARIFDELDDLVVTAHVKAGAEMRLRQGDDFTERGHHRYPCMDDTRPFRVVRSRVTSDGEELVDDQSDAVH